MGSRGRTTEEGTVTVPVPLKVSKGDFDDRFRQEARSLAQLSHPNICTLHDVGPSYLVMEFIEGAPLKGPVPVEKAIEYRGQILDALDVAHRKGIIHRDLKPSKTPRKKGPIIGRRCSSRARG
jgi:serine/threonine protein kinase